MAAPYTDRTALSNIIKTAYDRKMKFALRSTPTFRALADTKPSPETNPGSTVTFHEYSDMAVATTPLDEITDPAGAVIANPTPVSVTVNEYGNYTVVTKKLQEFALDKALDSNIGKLLANNMNDTVDALVVAVLDGSTNVIREVGTTLTPSSGVVTGVTASSLFGSKHVRYAVAKARGASVAGAKGDMFGGIIHPDVAHDFRAESGVATAWRDPHVYQDAAAIWAAELGAYEGVFWVENPRCTLTANAGAGATVDVYNTYIFGQEALAEVVVDEFSSVVGGVVVDPLLRKTPLGWKGTAGWALYRPKALTVVRTASSIGANT